MEVNQIILKQIYDIVEPYVIMEKLTLNLNTNFILSLDRYNVRIYIQMDKYLSPVKFYRFTYKDNKIYVYSKREFYRTFNNIEQFKDYMIELIKTKGGLYYDN